MSLNPMGLHGQLQGQLSGGNNEMTVISKIYSFYQVYFVSEGQVTHT
jgi:uncharacterized protein YgfB (UPF0149 family)